MDIGHWTLDILPSSPHRHQLRHFPHHPIRGDSLGVGFDIAEIAGEPAGVKAIGVSWGYHAPEALGAASAILNDFRDLPGLLDQFWR